MLKTLRKINIILAITFIFLVGSIVVWNPAFFVVDQISMFPTLNHGDRVIAIKNFSNIQRKDVIVFKKGIYYYCKRVIGLPGDTLHFKSDILRINGKRFTEKYIVLSFAEFERTIKLGQNEYYVMGDNRLMSRDSREFGSIKESSIIGKVWIKWRPLTIPK